MAKSLRCSVCGALLRNVAEAQSHGEITGHASFEESTDVVCSVDLFLSRLSYYELIRVKRESLQIMTAPAPDRLGLPVLGPPSSIGTVVSQVSLTILAGASQRLNSFVYRSR